MRVLCITFFLSQSSEALRHAAKLFAVALRPEASSGQQSIRWRNEQKGSRRLASIRVLNVAGGDLVFVGGEGCQDFGLLTLWDLEEIQGPSEFGCDFIKFCRGDPEFPVGFFQTERRRAGLSGRKFERPPRNVADPQRSH